MLAGVRLARYPARDGGGVRAQLARHHDVSPSMTAPCVGSTEVIFALPRLWKRAIVLGPTYMDYEAAYRRDGGRVRVRPYPEEPVSTEELVSALRRQNWDALVICNPNNPTGDYISPRAIASLCRAYPKSGIVVDETFLDMGQRCESVVAMTARYPNLLVLRSLAKSHGIGGLRFGYLVGHEQLLELVAPLLVPLGTGVVMEAVLPALLSHRKQYRKQWERILHQRDRMVERLTRLGFAVSLGRAPFFLLHVGDAVGIRDWLLRTRRILVRDCVRFGLDQWLRVMPRTSADNSKLLKALAAWKRR
jgi:histidinol-phosphate/aromatic aminotransferase/cobyric acid decarboxylase-like protein